MRRLSAGFVLLVVNGVYLAVRNDATLFYYGNVVLHLALGLGLIMGAALLLPSEWRRFPSALRLALLVVATGGLAGLVLAFTGATRPYYRLLVAHGTIASLGALLVLFYLTRAARQSLDRAGLAIAWVAILAAIVVFAGNDLRPDATYRIVNPKEPPSSMDGEGGGPQSPFFPSSARTNVGGTIPSTFFLTSEACGRCHREIYEQWKSSVHHFSSFNNQWYRHSIEYMQDVVGTRSSKWCAGCHDHAVFFNGRFDRPIREQIDTVEAQAGLACTSCHSIVHVGSTMGQGDFTIEYPPLHDLAATESRGMREVHDYLLKLAPGPHRATFLKTFHREQTPEFCSSCHKVHLDVPVNSYRWFRGFNEYDSWQASGVSGEGARSFYYPKKPQKCADCHMPLVASQDPGARDGQIHSHRFPAANTALPFVNHDDVQLKMTQDFLKDGQVTVDLFGLVREEGPRGTAETVPPEGGPRLSSTFAQGEEGSSTGPSFVLSAPGVVVAPLDLALPAVRQGESVRLEAVIRTRKVGHFFPGGTVDAYDCWVELEAMDGAGKVIFHSGGVDDDGRGPVDRGAHFYRSLLIDDHGNPINKRNAWMARSVAYVHLIPPGAADTVHYRLRVPENARGPIHLSLRLRYRKFAWWNTQWAFAGVRDPLEAPYEITADHDDGQWLFTGDTSHVSGQVKAIPDIPTTTMASAEAVLRVVPKGAPLPDAQPVMTRAVRERWNDYGIGLLLQGDLKAAEATFLKVTAMDPDYLDGLVNVARAQIQEGSLDSAAPLLEAALAKDPRLAKAHFFLGSVLKSNGRYDDALSHFKAASSLYPRDRVVLNEMGRVLFLQRRYADALAVLARVLEVDPEDLQAHYTLMLCRRGLGDLEGAGKEQVLYERFKADEAAQFVTGSYRKLHPADNTERQAIHEHETAPLSQAPPTVTAGGGSRR